MSLFAGMDVMATMPNGMVVRSCRRGATVLVSLGLQPEVEYPPRPIFESRSDGIF